MRLSGFRGEESISINCIGQDVYPLAAGAALLSFVGENAGHAQNVVGMREHPGVDPPREALHDQAPGSRESSEFIHFEHDRPLKPFPQQHAHEHKVGVSFIKDGIRLTPQDWQQPKRERQVVKKLQHLKNQLRTLAAYVFPNSLKAACTVLFTKKWHHSSGLLWINPWRRYDRHFVSICF